LPVGSVGQARGAGRADACDGAGHAALLPPPLPIPDPLQKAEGYQGGRVVVSLEAKPRDSYTPPPVWWGSGRKMRPSLPPSYRPSEDEEFMNPLQLEYFRQKLLRWRAELLAESMGVLQHLREENLGEPDLNDRASLETERALELRTRARERRLISKIDAALRRIEQGTYGYCEETDEPIGIRRLEARPIATLSIEAQERHERMERTHRDD
jgi:DnaK suppressor protein